MNSLVSVVIPIYNAESSIRECVESILNQTYQNYELILVDDGSTDRSAEICDTYWDQIPPQRCTVIHKANGGVSSARNAGIAQARGDYFVFVDSDDCVNPNYLQAFMDAKAQYPQVGHIWCGYQAVSSISQEASQRHVLSEEQLYTLCDRKDYMELCGKCFTQMPWNKLYKTELVKKQQIKMQEDLSLGEDIIFNLDYLDAQENTQILFINDPCYIYMQGEEDSLSNKYRPDLLQIYNTIDKAMKDCLTKWNVDDQSWTAYYNGVFYGCERVFRNEYHPNNRKPNRGKIKFINSILKSEEYKQVLRNCDCISNSALAAVYRLGSYRCIQCFFKAAKLKASVKKVFTK